MDKSSQQPLPASAAAQEKPYTFVVLTPIPVVRNLSAVSGAANREFLYETQRE